MAWHTTGKAYSEKRGMMIHFKALHRHRRKDDGKICPKPERLSAQGLGLRATHYIMDRAVDLLLSPVPLPPPHYTQ
jgi:hypothetical protein